jgi:hypothetical protein
MSGFKQSYESKFRLAFEAAKQENEENEQHLASRDDKPLKQDREEEKPVIGLNVHIPGVNGEQVVISDSTAEWTQIQASLTDILQRMIFLTVGLSTRWLSDTITKRKQTTSGLNG